MIADFAEITAGSYLHESQQHLTRRTHAFNALETILNAFLHILIMSLVEQAAELGITGPYPGLRLQLFLVAQVLALFLRSPDNSPICAATVAKSTRRLIPEDADGKHCFRLLRTDLRACLDAMVRFVAVPRTEVELRRLETKLNDCRCDLVTYEVLQVIHDSDNGLAHMNFKGMISSIFSVLGRVVLNGLKVGHVAGVQSALSDDSTPKKWPANTAALFPAGPDEAVVSFARLFRLTQTAAILDYIRIVLPHSPSLAMSIFNSTLFWEVAVEQLEMAVENFDPAIIRSFSVFLQVFVATVAECLRQNIASSPGLNSCGRKVHDLLVKFLVIAKASPNRDKLRSLCFLVAGMAMCVLNAIPAHGRPRRRHPLIASSMLPYTPKAVAFTDVYAVLSRLTSIAQCCNALCTETSESSAQRLRSCAKCRVMRYCSSACQKTAWKYHKIVCADIETLYLKVMQKLDGPADTVDGSNPGACLLDFEKKARKAGFSEERMKVLAAELTPFSHFQNVGLHTAPTHQDAKHY
ncbi:hypothetical protein C8R47DRAFT_1065056 [Mycena vitilis]|nr:hypothetical protein C8R47DRAFT_1065056 [Mycena vitilis]